MKKSKLTENAGVAVLAVGACVWFGMIGLASWRELVRIDASGSPIDDKPVTFDETTAMGRELRRIANEPGWRDDPELVKRYQEVCNCKLPPKPRPRR